MSESETESIVEALQASFDEANSDPEPELAEAAPADSEQELVAETEDRDDTPIEENEVAVEAEEDNQDEEPTGIPAPEHWSSEEKEQFAALSPEAQQILVDRDASFQKGYQERVAGITDLQSAIEPWKQMIAQMGISEADAIRTMFATYNNLRNDPLSGIRNLATNFGVLDQLTPTDTDDDYLDPGVKALREQIHGLQGQISQLTQSQQSQVESQGQQQINAFKNATDADGNLSHPHFEECIPLITSLVSQGKSLEEAYDQAKWTIPAFRDSNKPKSVGQTDEQKAAKVKQARRAAKTVKTPKGASPEADEQPLSLQDELMAAFNEATQ